MRGNEPGQQVRESDGSRQRWRDRRETGNSLAVLDTRYIEYTCLCSEPLTISTERLSALPNDELVGRYAMALPLAKQHALER
jgi:hypothetical protein